MRGRWAVTACLLGLTVLSSGRVAAQEPKGSIDTRAVLENDEVTVALLTFPPARRPGTTSASRPRWGSWSRAS